MATTTAVTSTANGLVPPVVYSVTVNGTPTTEPIINVSIDMCWGNHDLVAIRIEYNRGVNMAAITPWPANAVISMQWGRSAGTLNTWYGYLNHYEMKSNSDSGLHNLQITYYCLGTSAPMNNQASYTWGNVTPTYVAKTMAKRYGFRCVVTSTATVQNNLTQANMSDFQFMNYLAQKTGFRFWCSNGTLYFVDPAIYFSGSNTQGVNSFQQDKLQIQQDTMRDFTLLQGSNLPGSVVANRVVYGVDGATGNLISSSTGGSGPTIVNTSRSISSVAEGQDVINAWAGLSQFWIGASAELFGDQGIYPGKVVYLTGNALPGGNIGYWVVARAKHLLLASGTSLTTNDKYTTQVDILRNSGGTMPKYKGVVTVSPEIVTCVNNGGKWQASNQSVIVDGIANGA
jgi:hypothetical protein